MRFRRTPKTEENKVPDGSSQDDVRELLLGMKFAALAITDDAPGTLRRVAGVNPWHQEALALVTGSVEEAHRPLSEILGKHFGLALDAHIDVSGITKGGHFLDTQGYIAHNDKMIVLSYRCTTSVYDWLTNFSTTSSTWEVEEDHERGFSGYCSGLDCLWGARHQPRVHTGFYNNFLSSLPLIKQHIEPLLRPDQPPRTLYVTGHSLGAGVATLASCYFLLHFDWNALPQQLCSVTAGSPRTCGRLMRDLVEERLQEVSPARVRFHRLVRGRDAVASVPPKAIGFRHVAPATVISDDGKVTLPLSVRDIKSARSVDGRDEEEEAPLDLEALVRTARPAEATDSTTGAGDDPTKYEKLVSKVPQALRDHMPDFYLRPLLRVNGICAKSLNEGVPVAFETEKAPEKKVKSSRKMLTRVFGKKSSASITTK